MPIEPVKIPANVQVEEKILGPISLRQIILLMICGAISYFIWTVMENMSSDTTIAGTVIAWTPLAVGAMFAFVKINDVTLFRMLLLYIETMDKPTTRTFGPRGGISINIQTKPTSQQEAAVPKQKKGVSEQRFAQLSTLLDTGVDSLVPNQPSSESVEPNNPVVIADDQPEAPETHDDMTEEHEEHPEESIDVANHDWLGNGPNASFSDLSPRTT